MVFRKRGQRTIGRHSRGDEHRNGSVKHIVTKTIHTWTDTTSKTLSSLQRKRSPILAQAELDSSTDKAGWRRTTGTKGTNIAIADYYVRTLDSPPEFNWGGRFGAVSIIRKALNIPKGSTKRVRTVLRNVNIAYDEGKVYDGSRTLSSIPFKYIINDPVEIRTTLDHLERNSGFSKATAFLNILRQKSNKIPVGISSVISLHHRCCPKVMRPDVGRQGSKDPKDKWSIARMNQTGQQARVDEGNKVQR